MKLCLVVDDSEVIRKVVRNLLSKLKLDVVEAEHGLDAIERCKSMMPDIILLDWNMPVMNAMDFLAALRSVGGNRRPFVLYCTTENDVADINRALAAGAHDYILKPFDRTMLEGKLSEHAVAA